MDYKELRRLIILLNEGKDLTDWAKTKLINFVNMEETKQFDIPVVVVPKSTLVCKDDKKSICNNPMSYECCNKHHKRI